jgi:signal transduction histidine kinase
VLEEQGAVLRGVGASDPRHRDFVREVRVDTSGPSIAARAVQTRKPAVMEDVATSTQHARDLAAHFAEKSAIALPLLVQGRAVGAIVMDDVRKVRVWTPLDIDRAELVAQHVATGIANARLYEEVRSRSEELERAQQQLVKRERLAALGELAAVMAHEVRNPLGVLFNSLGTLGKVLPPGGDARTLLDIMREEAERLERLVKELLDFARPLAPSFEQESVRAVIAGAVDAARRALAPGDDTGPTIGMDVAGDVPTVRLDASMIRRALVNLVVNGYQAAGPSGRVTVRARRSGSFVEIDVLDTGPGIPPELTARVFEPFFTTKATGTGLGLAVVKSIVDSHGGEIDLRSRPGSGTTVTVVLPIDREASERRAGRPSSERKLVP